MKKPPSLWVLACLAAAVAVAGGAEIYLDHQRAAADKVAPNYTLIEPGFYLGGRPGKPSDADAVLNLTTERDDFTGAIIEWQPIRDAKPPPSLDWLRQQVAWIDTQRHAGRTVFVHCDFGASRSGMVAAAYFMWRDHLTASQALDFLRAKRSRVHPNASFVALLAQWEASLENAASASRP